VVEAVEVVVHYLYDHYSIEMVDYHWAHYHHFYHIYHNFHYHSFYLLYCNGLDVEVVLVKNLLFHDHDYHTYYRYHDHRNDHNKEDYHYDHNDRNFVVVMVEDYHYDHNGHKMMDRSFYNFQKNEVEVVVEVVNNSFGHDSLEACMNVYYYH
jgi:hypothetical protein